MGHGAPRLGTEIQRLWGGDGFTHTRGIWTISSAELRQPARLWLRGFEPELPRGSAVFADVDAGHEAFADAGAVGARELKEAAAQRVTGRWDGDAVLADD